MNENKINTDTPCLVSYVSNKDTILSTFLPGENRNSYWFVRSVTSLLLSMVSMVWLLHKLQCEVMHWVACKAVTEPSCQLVFQ